eukprot:CAMPEP_0202960624 /NCGR_PEP_ID=MMETSP1396-20130829/4783_1 /ASSEMBLY_ACC=CAM_ASM_000872 /TAXON_ID= /ORGANISM="Pseudokeronopsis sp., Strain Brazil" /LENGTH=64 /DNA_ID=CAMNT_0049679973 /DNA_START=119 /DNA_END=313 /DNA_ORIENTATION=+
MLSSNKDIWDCGLFGFLEEDALDDLPVFAGVNVHFLELDIQTVQKGVSLDAIWAVVLAENDDGV